MSVFAFPSKKEVDNETTSVNTPGAEIKSPYLAVFLLWVS